MNNILHVPTVKKNLLSVKKLCDDNNQSITFDSSSVSIKDRATNMELIAGGVAEGLYQLENGDNLLSINLGVKAPISVWHARLGHCNERITRTVINDSNLPISSNSFK